MKQKIKDRLLELPADPGVYLMKNSRGGIIYIGKAKVLKNRVRSYFQESRKHSSHRAAELIQPWVDDIDWVITPTELDALILEANLIQKHQPKFNVRLKDGKHYPYIMITTSENFPRAKLVRRVKQDGNKYFGPFTSGKQVYQVLELLPKLFQVRECDLKLPAKELIRPCLNYHINRCDAPCADLCTPEEYQKKTIDKVIDLLSGKYKKITSQLEEKMMIASKKMDFENAADLRDQVRAIKAMNKRSQVDMRHAGMDMDLIALAQKGDQACIVMMEIREGALLDRRHLNLECLLEQEQSELYTEFLINYYREPEQIPAEICFEDDFEGSEILREHLRRLKSGFSRNEGEAESAANVDERLRSVRFLFPKIGERKKLLKLAQKNAEMLLVEQMARLAKIRDIEKSVDLLQRELGLVRAPKHIEGYDISHLGGTQTVASGVCFKEGRPSKRDYRKYNIKTVDYIDDFASMREVMRRRLRRHFEEGDALPDLFLIDGGRGQVEAAWGVICEYGLQKSQQLVGLAKREEEVFFPGDPRPVMIDRHSPALKLLQKVRNESHRFAITHQRNRRKTRMEGMIDLKSVPGLGEKSRNTLLHKYHTMANLKNATMNELRTLIGDKRAKALTAFMDELKANES